LLLYNPPQLAPEIIGGKRCPALAWLP
jgi:hypothetical protein